MANTKSKKTAAKKTTRATLKKALAKKKVAKKAVKVQSKKKKIEKTVKAKAQDKLDLHDIAAKTIGSVAIDQFLREGAVNQGVIWQGILKYRAGQHLGTASTKDRGAVRGGGKKPWKQKGTGQARHGSRRSPIWRGGGTTFGPQTRDYSYTVPKKILKNSLLQVLKAKIQGGNLFLVDKISVKEAKSKNVSRIVEAFKVRKPILVVEKKDVNLELAARNVSNVAVKTSQEVNAYDLASSRECLLSQQAYNQLIQRLKND